ncbi:prosaposin-like [Amphiura filiformis]|uniref:prosaposin-like n=1 Tax=Amphiura filiformis TaxID=82378 RepID=UPI003B214BA7
MYGNVTKQYSKVNHFCFLQVKAGDPCTDCKASFGDVKMLLSNATTQNWTLTSICGTLGFCQGVDTTQMIAALTRVVIKVKMLPTADMCTDCKMFFGDVQKVLVDPNNQQTIISAVEQVCSLLGDLSSECQSFVEQYGSTVINAVAQVLVRPQNTCNTIGFCGMLPKLRVKAGDPCTDCKASFGDVKMLLSNATTQKELLNDIKMSCSLLGDLADQCNLLIDQYGPLFFDLLLPELDATSICGTLGFCQGVDTTQMIAALTRVVIKVKMLPTADMCTDCKMFFGDVQKVLVDPNNQQTIISAVEQVCSLLGDLSSECQSLVEQYGSTVINAVAQVLVKAGDPCTDCKASFGDVKMLLSNATTQKELHDIKMSCSLLGDLADQCNLLIDQYGPLFFDLLLPELDATSICGTL